MASARVCATVTQCHTGTKDLAAVVRTGDIVIAAAGSAGLITAEMVKPGAVLLDVGTSRNEAGKIVGVSDDYDAVIRGEQKIKTECGNSVAASRSVRWSISA